MSLMSAKVRIAPLVLAGFGDTSGLASTAGAFVGFGETSGSGAPAGLPENVPRTLPAAPTVPNTPCPALNPGIP